MPTKAELRALIAAIEAGQRELNDEVLLAIGWQKRFHDKAFDKWTEWTSPTGKIFWNGKQPAPLNDLQDATLAVPEGFRFLLDKRFFAEQRGDGYRAHVWRGSNPSYESTETWASTDARALVLAGLKAREQEAEG